MLLNIANCEQKESQFLTKSAMIHFPGTFFCKTCDPLRRETSGKACRICTLMMHVTVCHDCLYKPFYHSNTTHDEDQNEGDIPSAGDELTKYAYGYTAPWFPAAKISRYEFESSKISPKHKYVYFLIFASIANHSLMFLFKIATKECNTIQCNICP